MAISYNVDDVVLYGTEGICRITCIEQREMMDKMRDYYILKPVYRDKTTILVPVDNEKLVGRMRLALTKSEVVSLIEAMLSEDIVWIADESERVATYKGIIASGDVSGLVQIIRALKQHKIEHEALGKKVHAVDERLLKNAEALLHDEFAYALGIETNEVMEFITETLEADKKAKPLFSRKK